MYQYYILKSISAKINSWFGQLWYTTARYWDGQNEVGKIMNAKVLQNNIVIFPFISFGVEETKMFSITILLATDSWINSAFRIIITKQEFWHCFSYIFKLNSKYRCFVMPNWLKMFKDILVLITILFSQLICNIQYLKELMVNIFCIIHFYSAQNCSPWQTKITIVPVSSFLKPWG